MFLNSIQTQTGKNDPEKSALGVAESSEKAGTSGKTHQKVSGKHSHECR